MKMNEELRKAMNKWYAKEKYTGTYLGSYKGKFNRDNHPDALKKRFDKLVKDLSTPREVKFFVETLIEFYKDPRKARGYDILERAYDETHQYFNAPVYDDYDEDY